MNIELRVGTVFWYGGEKRIVKERTACGCKDPYMDCQECKNCKDNRVHKTMVWPDELVRFPRERIDGKCVYFKKIEENEKTDI